MRDNRFVEEVVVEIIAEMQKANISFTEENIRRSVRDKFSGKNKEKS